VEDFLAEYQYIPDEPTLEQLTMVSIMDRPNPIYSYPMTHYTHYTHLGGPFELTNHAFVDLLPRKPFTKWFFGVFFRLALPFNQNNSPSNGIILSPLNLTILFRLISYLSTIGYPSHWLSECLENVIENKVVTTARPPRTKPMRPADVQRNCPAKKLCTAPFSYEMATLAQLFQPLLSFTLTSPLVPERSTIYEYTFHLPSYSNADPQHSCLALVFTNPVLSGPHMLALAHDVRTALTDEDGGIVKGPDWEVFREKVIVVWTTFTWDLKEEKARAWIPESLLEMVVLWACGLYRTDVCWPVFHVPALVAQAVSKGERWGQ
jgi:hypothetical protein